MNLIKHFTKKHFSVNQLFRFMLTVFLLVNLCYSSIARAPRKDLNNDFTDAQRKEMCELVDQWLTTYLITMHGDDFGRMHTTNDYLRWHRDHFKDLEEFILDKGKPEYIPFPKWNPANPVPSYFNGWEANGITPYNNISAKCGGGGCRTREDYTNAAGYLFNQNGIFSVNLPLPTRFSFAGTLNNSTNISAYSNDQQLSYHNRGHLAFDRVNNVSTLTPELDKSLMGSGLTLNFFNRAASAYIFWAWHAWIDDLWYDWDRCPNRQNTGSITWAYDLASGITIPAGAPTIWNIPGNVKKVRGKIIVPQDATLIIDNGQIVEILDDYFTDMACGIEVQAGSPGRSGGRLIIKNGAIIRGITSLGTDVGNGTRSTNKNTGDNIYPDRKVYYLSSWPGIEVKGNLSAKADDITQGLVSIEGTSLSPVLIQGANTGIKSTNGGAVIIKFAVFRNCSTSVNFMPYIDPVNPNMCVSSIFNTTFEITDQVSRYFENDNMYMHYKHNFHMVEMLRLEGIRGLSLGGNTFINSDPNVFPSVPFHDDTRGKGIHAINATFFVHKDGAFGYDEFGCPKFNGTNGNTFTNLSTGILSEVTSPLTTDGNFVVDNSTFTNCHHSIEIIGNELLRLQNNTFVFNSSHLFQYNPPNHHDFIILRNVIDYIINGNTFNSSFGIEMSCIQVLNTIALTPLQINNSNRKIYGNNFTNTVVNNTSHGIELNGPQDILQYWCNNFTDFQHDVEYLFGADHLSNIGSTTKSANNKATKNGVNAGLFINNLSGNSFFYYNDPVFSIPPTGPPTVMIRTGNPAGCAVLTCTGFPAGMNAFSQTNTFNLYPNPTEGMLKLTFKEKLNNDCEVKVFDMNGKLVFAEKITENSTEKSINLSELNNGLYNVSIFNNKGIISTRKVSLIK